MNSTAELEQLPKLRRPVRRKGVRPVGGEWDWFYEGLTPHQRSIASRHMSPDGMSPDELATVLGTDVDEAMQWWWRRLYVNGVAAHNRTDKVKVFDERKDDEAHTPWRDEMLDPRDIAHLLGVSHGTVHQWVKRDVICKPARRFGNVPVWWKSDIQRWAADTGRERPQEAF